MADVKAFLEDEAKELRRLRDELRVQAHLGKAEAKERWEKLEKDWQRFEGRVKVLGEESRHSLEAAGEALKLAAQELRDGYRHLKNLV